MTVHVLHENEAWLAPFGRALDVAAPRTIAVVGTDGLAAAALLARLHDVERDHDPAA